MLYNAKESKVRVNDMDIDYISFGSGQKPLIMIQGLNTRGIKGSALPLAYMYRIFAKDYKVYLFDRRPDVKEGITVKEVAEDIAVAMDNLGITNADILGVSQGGMIAQYLAIDRSDLVNKLVLAFTLSRNNDKVVSAIETWVELVEKGKMKQLIVDMAERMYSESYLKMYRPFLPLLTAIQKPTNVQRFVILANSCLTCNTYDVLNEIKCPVLVIGGQKDKIVGGEASIEIAEKLGCKIHMYDELGHAAYEEANDFNSIVYEFLK
ncbi:MAG: alpha/beta hydrolase [Clostridia bacterium]|nr:alpha/beta hydrolase [Clostridia bacterium]